jgi:predicted DsbA family dithiol-disulfide isomerase
MLVEIYSDVVCPWCYIGKRRFEEALARRSDADVTVVWRPFQLDPNAPTAPSPVVDAYARKFGGPERAVQIIDHMSSVAREAGLEFHLDVAQRSNTLDAHRLLWFALQQGGPAVQDALKERLLQAYFVDGEHVGSHAVLARLAAEVGLDEDEVLAFLDGDGGRAEVRAELNEAYERGITAVPTFVFDGRYSVPGAQDPELFVRVLDKLGAERAPVPAGHDARTCTDDACEV